VLIIEKDEWISTLLVKFLSGAGYECQVATDAREGFKNATEQLPDCIICDVMLPDIDGFWVARRVRGERSRLASTPFAFLAEVEDPELRLQGLSVGADVFMSPPFRHEEVVAQVNALVGMAERLRDKHDSAHPAPRGASALRGDIAQISVPTLLTMLEMERRTGELKVTPKNGSPAVLEIVDGELDGAKIAGLNCEPLEVMRSAIHWRSGEFSFQPGEPGGTNSSRRSLSGLLLEAMRLLDEDARSG
jgi:two-component system, OmpR family, response regulator